MKHIKYYFIGLFYLLANILLMVILVGVPAYILVLVTEHFHIEGHWILGSSMLLTVLIGSYFVGKNVMKADEVKK